MLKHRVIVGALLILLVVGGLWLDGVIDDVALSGWVRDLFLGRDTMPRGSVIFVASVVVSVLAARELGVLLREKGVAASRLVMSLAALIGLCVSCLVPKDAPAVASVAAVSTAAVFVLVGSMVFYARRQDLEGVIAAAGATLLAFVYLGLMFGFVLAIRRLHTEWVILWVLMVTKSCDIGAYFTGRAVGRHKLIPWLSPGKTWEGLVGGVALAAAVAGFGWWALLEAEQVVTPGVWGAAAAGAVFGVTGQLGDLLASMFKRDAGVKDAGASLPGFGGVLDVLDSPLLVMPAAYWWLLGAA